MLFHVYADGIREMFPDKEIISAPNGIDSDHFKPITYENKKIRFLFVP